VSINIFYFYFYCTNYILYIYIYIPFTIVISNWITANPTEGKDINRSHVHGNILALKNGCVTSKAFRIFAKNHQNLKMKEILTVEQNRAGAKYEGPFGRKTEL
jgi:hypothetical protein